MRLCCISDKLEKTGPEGCYGPQPDAADAERQPLVVAFGDAGCQAATPVTRLLSAAEWVSPVRCFAALDGLNHFSILDALGDPQSQRVPGCANPAARNVKKLRFGATAAITNTVIAGTSLYIVP
jgi:hypothetical protein